MISNCLTYEQLHAYSTHTINNVERGHLYMHISSCELCACAVNGFAAHPFASDELVAIHREIDARTNATAANPLTSVRVFIIVASLLAITAVYKFADQPAAGSASVIKTPIETSPVITPVNHETKAVTKEEVSSVTKTFKKIVNVIQYKEFDRKITPVQELELIKPYGIVSSSAREVDADIIAPHFNSNAIYIYDLKVSDYDKLYFSKRSDESLFKTHTPVFKENKKSVATDMSPEHSVVAADRVLKHGLASFNKQDFGPAIADFNLLLENNPKDVNAQFYIALAYYNLNKTAKAIEMLNIVLKNENDAFYPEAQWYLALVELKTGSTLNARQLLQSIVSEKGFYSKRAIEKLNELTD